MGPFDQMLHYRIQSVIMRGFPVRIVASAPRAAVLGPLKEAMLTLGISLGVLAIALILAMLVQVRLGLRPLQHLRRAVSDIRSRLRVTIFVDKETGDLTASDDEVAKLYDTFKAQGKMTRREKTRDIAVILLRARGGSDEDWRGAETRAKEARARIEGGETFDAVAR